MCSGKRNILVFSMNTVKDLIHMHGELLKARCQDCGAVFPLISDIGNDDACVQCSRKGVLRPHLVCFQEMPLGRPQISQALKQYQTLVYISSSGRVYPAVNLVEQYRSQGIHTLDMNFEPSQNSNCYDVGKYGWVTEIVPAWVDQMFEIFFVKK